MLVVLQDPVALVLVGLGAVAILLLAIATKGIEWLAFALLAGAAFFVTHVAVRVGPVLLADLFLVTASLPILVLALTRPIGIRLARAYLRVIGLVSVLLVGGLLASLFSLNPLTDLSALGRFTLASAALMGLFALWAPTRQHLQRLALSFLLGAVTSAAFGPLIVGSAISGSRWVGLSGHPNRLGATSYLAVGIALGFFFSSPSVRLRLFCLACAVFLAASVFATQSRGGVFALGVVVVLVLAYLHRWVMLAGTIGVGGLVVTLVNPFHRSGVSASNAERLDRLTETWTEIGGKPFGGSGFSGARYTHSLYLDAWASAGLLGLIFVLGLVVLARHLLRRAHQNHDSLALGLACGFAGQLVASMFSPAIWDRYLWLYLALAIGLTAHQVVVGVDQGVIGRTRRVAIRLFAARN